MSLRQLRPSIPRPSMLPSYDPPARVKVEGVTTATTQGTNLTSLPSRPSERTSRIPRDRYRSNSPGYPSYRPTINNNATVSPYNYVYDENGPIPDAYDDYYEEIRLYTCCNTWLNDFQLRAQHWVPAGLQHTGVAFDTHCHSTQGYLEDGNVFRFLYMPEAYLRNTTSIGLYIHSNDTYSEMNWVTYKPSLKGIMEKWEDEGIVQHVETYSRKSKPSADRRMHKAYFLASTEQNPGNLFSQRTPPPTAPVSRSIIIFSWSHRTLLLVQHKSEDRADSDGPSC